MRHPIKARIGRLNYNRKTGRKQVFGNVDAGGSNTHFYKQKTNAAEYDTNIDTSFHPVGRTPNAGNVEMKLNLFLPSPQQGAKYSAEPLQICAALCTPCIHIFESC